MTTLYEKTQPPSQRELLDDALERLVDRVMADDRDGALSALLDALAFGLAGAGTAAEVWTEQELALLQNQQPGDDDADPVVPDKDREVDDDEDQLELQDHPT